MQRDVESLSGGFGDSLRAVCGAGGENVDAGGVGKVRY